MNRKVLIGLFIAVLIVIIVVYNKRKKTGGSEEASIFDFNFEGDNYNGSKYYVGDKGFYENDKGRKVANAVPSSLYKVVEPAYKLKYEFNDKGVKSLIKISPNNKPDLIRGSQLRIIKESEETPMIVSGNKFVQSIYGNFIRLDKIKKIRD